LRAPGLAPGARFLGIQTDRRVIYVSKPSGATIAKYIGAKRRERLVPYLFILPFLVSFVVFFLAPALYSLVLSFYQFKGYGAMKFKGWANYQSLLTYSTFWASIRNTLFYFIMHTIPTMVLAFTFAYMLQSKLMSRRQSVLKPVLFMPQIVPIIASSLIFRILLATQYGAVNQILGTQINFLGEGSSARWAVVLMQVWRATGWYMVIYMAGLTNIADDIQEAAKIDGANVMQRISRIVLPMMKPIFLFAFVMDAIGSFKIFTEPNVLLSSSTGLVTKPEVIPVMNVLLMNLNGANFGMASATGWLIFLLVLIASLLQFKVLGSEKEEKVK
jgi:ABC-type sugar transport system permease subunit